MRNSVAKLLHRCFYDWFLLVVLLDDCLLVFVIL